MSYPIEISKNENTISINLQTVITGLALHTLFGTQIAVIGVIVELALSHFNKEPSEDFFNKRHLHIIKNAIYHYSYMFPIHILFAAFQQKEPFQEVAKIIKQNFSKGFFNKIKWSYLSCIQAPIIEEIIFRGFIQKNIKIIQENILNLNPDSFVNRICRIALQAILFGIAHYHRLHTLAINTIIISIATLSGAFLGYYKEKTNSLFGTITIHALHNTCILSRLVLLA